MRLLTTTVTSLELRQPPERVASPPASDTELSFREIRDIALDAYRTLYRSVGDPHHWTSRILPDDRLDREIHDEATRIFVLLADDIVAGWFELEMRRSLKSARIVHLGIMPAFRGRGLADHLVSKAIVTGFSEGAERLTIETNTLDHPAALPLYRKHGFTPYATRMVQTPAIESVEALAREHHTPAPTSMVAGDAPR
ncbi:GNAT family N-acetyltransferase [Aurantimonas coralicida]|jgi:GNAT superfamily N-acetyltransferase|uniref:GNAT family N-acetyltransferase n=1 Tax=Aurantimonas TaxID=182269 RepID=UPI00041BC568|nr:GNAT family N-acetyltransferase [Aurantimonas coralicida]